MLNKLFISFIILSFLSCIEQKNGINGTWVYIGWGNSDQKGVMSGGFVNHEKYWEFSNSKISIHDKSFKYIGSMEYKTQGDTIIINNKIHYLYSLNNDTLRMKELFSESNVWKVLIRK